MKKFITLLSASLFLLPVFSASAVGTANDYSYGEEEVKELGDKRRSTRIQRGVGRSEYQIKQLSSSRNKSTERASRRIGYGFRAVRSARIVSQRAVDTSVLLESSSGFSIRLPEGYTIHSDTFEEENGKFVLRNGETFVRVQKTSTNCPTGLSPLRACLSEELKKMTTEKLSAYKNLERQDQREFTIERLASTSAPVNIAKWLRLYVDGNKIGFMVFVDKESGSLVRVTVDGPSTSKLFLQPKYLLLLGNSLSQKEGREADRVVSGSVLQNVQYTNDNRQQRSMAARRTATTSGHLTSRLFTTHTSESGEIKILLPNSYVLTQDELEAGGQLVFTSGDQSVVFTQSEQVCVGKDDMQKRRLCMERFAKTLKDEFENEYPRATQLEEENTMLHLIPTESYYGNDIARFMTWFQTSNRYGIIVFVSPVDDTLWSIEVKTKDQRSGILSDPQNWRKVLRSIRIK